MNNIIKKTIIFLVFIVLSSNFSLYANFVQDQIVYLDLQRYRQVVSDSRSEITHVLRTTASSSAINVRIIQLLQHFADRPYISEGSMGEGDWVAAKSIYHPGDAHIKQDPVYRLDGFDCQTLVQVILGLLHADQLATFENKLIHIAYGAAGPTQDASIHYYNRNHFVEADFNPINNRNGVLTDITSDGVLAKQAKYTSAIITRNAWFRKQMSHEPVLRILDKNNLTMLQMRLIEIYDHLNFPNFDSQKINLSYIPKNKLLFNAQTTPQLNPKIFNLMPLPAVAEIVRDTNKWFKNEKNIKDLIGSELMISHLGIIYRQQFKKNEVIYHKIICSKPRENNTYICKVQAVLCEKKYCPEVMFAHATSAYPNGYFWYQLNGSQYACTKQPPSKSHQPTTFCNRVERLPLSEYLTKPMLNGSSILDNDSILGIHFEKIN